jgi:hypothetical protein
MLQRERSPARAISFGPYSCRLFSGKTGAKVAPKFRRQFFGAHPIYIFERRPESSASSFNPFDRRRTEVTRGRGR